MACSLAENQPLSDLRKALSLPRQCHSRRPSCLKGLEARSGDDVLGIAGAALGYCQALFNSAGNPEAHTAHVQDQLARIGAPWANSHELFWGYRREEPAAQYVSAGIRPLEGNGRVPILISGLDADRDRGQIEEILATEPRFASGEPVLLRMVMGSPAAVDAAAEIIQGLISHAMETGEMPRWWPLLQGELPVSEWSRLRTTLGAAWRFVNVAVNPFASAAVLAAVAAQVTVAQVPIGLAEGMDEQGNITLAPGMQISGASECARYSLDDYVTRLSALPEIPTLIILGPSRPEWTVEVNAERIARLIPLLRAACERLWGDLPGRRRALVWSLAA
jgi:hypothetical protein